MHAVAFDEGITYNETVPIKLKIRQRRFPMSITEPVSPESIASQRDAFVERFLGFASGTFSLFSIYMGDRLGLYRALAEGGPATSTELASRTGTHERYIREWLE